MLLAGRTAFAVALALIVTLMLPARAAAQSLNSVEKETLNEINALRKTQKAAALRLNAQLVVMAQNHARAMAKKDRYGDSDKNGHILNKQGPAQRIVNCGYDYSLYAENVAYNKGYTDVATAAVEIWWNSAGHKKNICNKEFIDTGVGAARGASGRWYFCQVFGRPESMQTAVTVRFENKTAKPVAFKIDTKSYTLAAGKSATYMHHRPSGAIKYFLGALSGALADDAKYAFVASGGKTVVKRTGTI